MHWLVPDLKHLDGLREDLRSKKFAHFFKMQKFCPFFKMNLSLKIDDVSTIIESKLNDLNETIEKRLHHLEDQIIGLQNLNQSGNVVSNEPVASSGFYVDLLKSRISELEKQLLEKNAVINFLTLQLISKPQDKMGCKI